LTARHPNTHRKKRPAIIIVFYFWIKNKTKQKASIQRFSFWLSVPLLLGDWYMRYTWWGDNRRPQLTTTVVSKRSMPFPPPWPPPHPRVGTGQVWQ
jgi:hypothetical protein